MIRAQGVDGRRIALFGLGVSGLACARSLRDGGADVLAWDDAEPACERARESNIALTDLSAHDWKDLDALVLAPGVPLTHPQPHWTVTRAQEAGVEVIGDTEIFMRALNAGGAQNRLIAITGTNGKSTTTALLAHILNHGGLKAELGGNIGTPVLELSDPGSGVIYVVEFSSYQIDLTPSLKPHVGILLNITPDHLDRHGDLEHYAAVKARLFANQNADDLAIIAIDDDLTRAISDNLPSNAQCVTVSSLAPHMGDIDVEDGVLRGSRSAEADIVGDLRNIGALRGQHNWQNAVAAYAAARRFGLAPDEIFQALRSFPGLAHRMEQVVHRGKILFVNDSKATNAEAAARALASFDRIYWIAGGLAKEGGIDGLTRFFPKIAKAYLIGDAADAFAAVLDGSVPFEDTSTMEAAVNAALRDAIADEDSEPVILLSPACASFDQYRNFEIRGDAFKSAVAKALEREQA